MANPVLTERVQNYLRRQIALYEAMIDAHTQFPEDLEGGAFEDALDRQGLHTREAAMLERECRVLLREWEAADNLDDTERETVRALSARAQELADLVSERNDEVIARIRERKAAIENDRGRMRRGAGTLRKYRPDTQPDTGYIDRKA